MSPLRWLFFIGFSRVKSFLVPAHTCHNLLQQQRCIGKAAQSIFHLRSKFARKRRSAHNGNGGNRNVRGIEWNGKMVGRKLWIAAIALHMFECVPPFFWTKSTKYALVCCCFFLAICPSPFVWICTWRWLYRRIDFPFGALQVCEAVWCAVLHSVLGLVECTAV